MKGVTIALVFFLAYLVPPVRPGNGNCDESSGSCATFSASIHEDQILIGYDFKTVTPNSGESCLMLCAMDCQCMSFQETGTECTLNTKNHMDNPARLKRAKGSRYGMMEINVRSNKHVTLLQF